MYLCTSTLTITNYQYVYLTQKQTLLCYRHRLLYGNSDYFWDSVVYLFKKDSFLVIVSHTQYILFPTIADNPVIRSGYPPRILHLLDLVGPGKNGGGMNCLESKPRTPVLRSRNQSEPTFLVRRQSRNLKAAPAPPKKQTKKCFTLQHSPLSSNRLTPVLTGCIPKAPSNCDRLYPASITGSVKL